MIWPDSDLIPRGLLRGYSFCDAKSHNICPLKTKSREEAQKFIRLTDYQTQTIRQLVGQVAESQSCVRVFVTRRDDTARGGDLDLMFELLESVDNPARTAALMPTLVSRAMHGRKVDVLLSAPNLMRMPIHDLAFKEGQLL